MGGFRGNFNSCYFMLRIALLEWPNSSRNEKKNFYYYSLPWRECRVTMKLEFIKTKQNMKYALHFFALWKILSSNFINSQWSFIFMTKGIISTQKSMRRDIIIFQPEVTPLFTELDSTNAWHLRIWYLMRSVLFLFSNYFIFFPLIYFRGWR